MLRSGEFVARWRKMFHARYYLLLFIDSPDKNINFSRSWKSRWYVDQVNIYKLFQYFPDERNLLLQYLAIKFNTGFGHIARLLGFVTEDYK